MLLMSRMVPASGHAAPSWLCLVDGELTSPQAASSIFRTLTGRDGPKSMNMGQLQDIPLPTWPKTSSEYSSIFKFSSHLPKEEGNSFQNNFF